MRTLNGKFTELRTYSPSRIAAQGATIRSSPTRVHHVVRADSPSRAAVIGNLSYTHLPPPSHLPAMPPPVPMTEHSPGRRTLIVEKSRSPVRGLVIERRASPARLIEHH